MKQRLRRPLAMLLTIVMLLGLLPTAAFAVEDETGAVGETKITKMTLQNFKTFGEDAVEDVDLLAQNEPLSWEATGSNTVCTINFTVALENGVDDKSLRITLPYGMQFVGLTEENGKVTNIESVTIESVEWEHSEPVYGNSSDSNYQRNNGTLVVHFKDEGATSSSFSINVQPDVAFLPPSQKTEGFLIKDAIQATVQVGDNTSEPASVDVKLHSDQQTITSSGVWNQQYTVTPGSESNTFSVTVYWQYLYPMGGGQIFYFIDKATVLFAVPDVFTVTDAKLNNVIQVTEATDVSDELKEKYPDCNFYTVTHENFYGASDALRVTYTVADQAETDQTYIVYPIYTDVTAYGQSDPNRHKFNQNGTIDQLKITVVDPAKTYLDVTARAILLTNYTELGNETGDFDDYNMLLSYVTIKNQGASEASNLIYEAQFDESPDLIRTAIRIPCQANRSEYPTELTIYYGDGQSIVLNSEQIQSIATKVNAGNTYSGIEIQLADVSGLPTDAQVTGIKARIPSLVQGYSNSSSYQDRFTSAVIGRIADSVANNTKYTDKYRIYPASASAEDIPEYTEVSITVNDTPVTLGADGKVPRIHVNGDQKTTAQPGDKIQISNISLTPTTWLSASQTMLAVDPIFYIVEPTGLNLSSISFTDGDGNPVYATKTEVSPTNEAEIAYGGKLYAYQLNNTLSGYWDGDMEAHSIQATVEYNVPYGIQTAAYDLTNLMFWASGISGTPFNASFPYVEDLYGLNGGKALGGYKSQTFSVIAPQDLSISSAMQIDGTDEWFVYDGTPSSVAVFGNNTTANVRVTVRNNTNGTLNSVEVYVPIPKTGTNLGTNFGPEDGYYFDMYVAGSATVPENWKVEYGVVENAPPNKQTAPVPEEEWSTSYSHDTNMVKISMTAAGGLPAGESADIILQLRATTNTSQNDKQNLFKSWYTYVASSGSGFDASTTMNFGALLQIGELSGTVYADSDRDSTMDAGEQGVENVRVTVTDESGRVYEDRTDGNGQYTISGLPSNQELTVTVYNPYSHENRAGARRFSAKNPSTTGTIGSDVTSTDSGQTGTITLTSLTGGKGVVNAGLVEPYHVQFKLDKTSDTGYVTPAELYVFPGQTLGDVTNRITVVTPAGQDFLDQWTKSVDSSTVQDSALLTEKVTADTIYTAQTQTRQSTVNATWWDAEAGTLTEKQSWTVEFGQKVPSTGNTPFPTDDAVNVRPGYDFKGWEVNGDSTNLKQREDIIEEPVYAGVNYVAHYEPKTDITVTLKANGGTFGESDTLTLSNLTYGGVVNNAEGYKAPTREDHYFVGWADEMSAESGTETLMVPTESKTYYAVWAEGEPENVTVSFDRMGGEWTESGASSFTTPLTGKPGTSLTLPDSDDITRTGYDFDDWYTDYDCSVPATDAFPSSTATWYAKWVPHKHTVTYDYNGGKVDGSEETKKVVENLDYDSLLTNIPAPQKPGYELIGWRITTEGRTDTGYIIPSANMTGRTVDGDITYEAYYVERPITVTFNANRYDSSGPAQFGDGTTQKLYQNILGEEMPFTDVPVPTREGYVFVGWEDDDGMLQSGKLTFTEATNYYASWEEATFTVTYRLNGGTVNGDADDITNEVRYEGTRPSAPAVTLPGSTLAYWLDMSTGNKYAAQANPEEDILAFPPSGVTSDEVYLAIWNTNQYTVTFTRYDYSQTGEGYGDSSQREVPTIYNGTPAAPAVVPPAGQAFDHWLMTAPTEGIDGQTEFTANELLALKVTQDMTFQAVFKATDYTVTFDANGGQFAGGSVPTYSVAYNAELSTAEDFAAPTVTKTGSEFRGWTKTGDDTLYTNNAQDGNYIGKAVITSDTVFIASWSGDVRVTFNANGGTISGADYAEGQAGTAISSAPTPTRYGYTFGGWYKDSNCEESAVEGDGTTYLFPTTNATWYAKWTAKSVTITFNYGEGTVNSDNSSTITRDFGSAVVENADDLPKPTRAGWTQIGWTREDELMVPNANMPQQVVNNEDGMAFTAYYAQNTVEITFDPNGGAFPDGSTEAKTYQRSQGGTMPFADVPVPTKDEQTFAGWKLQGAEDSSATTTGSMTFDTAKTYVAVWTDAEYTITFRLNGGTVGGSTDDVVENANHGDTFPTAPDVTLSGNTLQGWLNMADGKMYGGSNEAFPVTVAESATYIAIWGTNTYNVTFTKYDYSDQDAGDSSTLTIPTIYHGIPAAPTVTPPTGRQFTGWKITSGSLQGPDGTLDSNSAAITSADLTQCKVIGAVTLEAQYSDPTYTVTFIPGDGATLIGETTYEVTNGKTMADMKFTVPTASKDGATSTSWICSLDGEAMTADEIKELVINGDVTFTAVWVGDVTVSFVLNGGKITNKVPASVTGAPGTKVTVPLVEQDGYTFEGWYDAETGGNPVTFTDNKTTIGDTSVTYYARWTQNSLTVDPTTQTTTYNGIPAPLTWTVKDQQADSTLAEDDYDVTYFNQETGVVTVNKVPTEAGTYTVTFRGKNSYLGKTATATYTIEQADLSSAAVTVTDNSKTYNGSEQYASVNVTLGNTALIMGQDFTVTYDGNCVDAGSYSITVTGIGNYTGKAIPTEQLTIAPKELQDGMIQAIPPQYYTGQAITPEITVHDGELVLHKGTDFENVTYSNHIDVGNGTASVSITGKGNYTGDAKATFSIIAKSTYLEVSVDPASATYGDDLSGMTITVTANGTILTEYEDYQLSYQRYNQDGQPEEVSGIDEAGVYIITATGEGNYDGSKGSTVFILYPQDESDGMLVIGQGNIEVEYDGQNHLPAGFTVQWNDGSGALVDLTDADYELLYSYNNSVPMELVTTDTAFINVGIYVVTVKATGNYDGVATFVVTITPKDIASPDVDMFIDETTYNAGEQTADITVTDGSETLTEDVDYTVSNATYTDANEDGYEVLITGMGNYTGSRTELFIIHRAEIAVTTDTVSITYGDPLPDISTVIPSVNGIYDADAAGVTVTLAWPTDLSAGTHELTASLSGDRSSNYVVDASGALLIVSAKDMNGADSGVNATLDPDYGYYTGSPLTPNVVVTDSKLGTTLTEGRDYTVSYEDSNGNSISQLIDLGSYIVIVTGKGNYTGTFELVYTIKDRPSGGGGGGGGTTRYIIEAEAGWGGDISPDGRVSVSSGSDKTFRITADEGYEIADVIVDGESVGAVSSYTFENVRKNHTISVTFTEDEPVADPDDTGVSGWLNTSDHIQYLSGYGGGKFGPTDNMTRAQAAQMFYNLLLDQDVPITVSFTDVAADAWYSKAVNTLASLGIVDGIGDNHYAPERAITRAEFTVIAMRFAHLDTSGENIFSDVTADAWYYDYVVGSIQYGWINGYEDGTFRPNNTITRSEVTAIVNRMLGRSADKVFVDRHADELTQFSDVPGSYWAYYEIMEAANAHDYVKDNGVEDWTRLQ